MTGKTGKSGGARAGAGRAPIAKFRNRQAVRVQITLAGQWVDAVVIRERSRPDETVLLLDDSIGHITISAAPVAKQRTRRAKK